MNKTEREVNSGNEEADDKRDDEIVTKAISNDVHTDENLTKTEGRYEIEVMIIICIEEKRKSHNGGLCVGSCHESVDLASTMMLMQQRVVDKM